MSTRCAFALGIEVGDLKRRRKNLGERSATIDGCGSGYRPYILAAMRPAWREDAATPRSVLRHAVLLNVQLCIGAYD